jgi:hypothetical protein
MKRLVIGDHWLLFRRGLLSDDNGLLFCGGLLIVGLDEGPEGRFWFQTGPVESVKIQCRSRFRDFQGRDDAPITPNFGRRSGHDV